MDFIEKAFKIIEDHKDESDFEGPMTEKAIIYCEDRLNISLPKSYRTFLKRYGLGDIFGEEIFGLGTEPVGFPNIIWITEDLRKTDDLPRHLIPFYMTGFESEYLCLDCSQVEHEDDDNAPVVLYKSGASVEKQEFQVVYTNFGEFLFELLNEALDDEEN